MAIGATVYHLDAMELKLLCHPPRSTNHFSPPLSTSLHHPLRSTIHIASIDSEPRSTTHWDFADGFTISIQMLSFLIWYLTDITTQSLGEIPDQDDGI
jgi:hypothetical protein